MSLVRRGLAGVIITLSRTLRNSARENFLFIVAKAKLTSQSNDIAIQNESKWKFQYCKPRTVAFIQYKLRQVSANSGSRDLPVGVAKYLNLHRKFATLIRQNKCSHLRFCVVSFMQFFQENSC